jgi:hypothetical protein
MRIKMPRIVSDRGFCIVGAADAENITAQGSGEQILKFK